MTRSEEVASACASVARATTREEARAALETLRARMFRAFEASEASTRSSSEDATTCASTTSRTRARAR